jgi:hypothetical protein
LVRGLGVEERTRRRRLRTSIPTDGIVRSGKTDINESMITGESVPVRKTEGGTVVVNATVGQPAVCLLGRPPFTHHFIRPRQEVSTP